MVLGLMSQMTSRCVDDGIEEPLSIDKPVVVDVPVYQFENCYPMNPAGGCNHEMLLSDPPELQKRSAVSSQGSGEGKDTILTA